MPEAAWCAQAPTTAEQVPKHMSVGSDQEVLSQQHEGADTTPTQGLPIPCPDQAASVSSELAAHPASSKAPDSLPQKASGSPSEKASSSPPPAKPAESATSTAAPAAKSVMHLLAPDSSMSDAVTHAEPASELKENKEAKTDTLGGGEQEGDSGRLAVHYRASSRRNSSSSDISSIDEDITAASGDGDGAERQEAAEPADSAPLQPTYQLDAAAVRESFVKLAKKEKTAAANDQPLQSHKTGAAGNYSEQPTKQEGEPAASQHLKAAPISSEQAAGFASSKPAGALLQKASGAPSEKAYTPSPRAQPAVSTTWVDATPTKSMHPFASASTEPNTTKDAQLAKRPVNTEAKADTLNGREQEGDSWRLAALSTRSSSTEITSTAEGSTTVTGCAEQQEAAEAADSFLMQPAHQQDATAVHESLVKLATEEQKANSCPLQPREIIQETAAGNYPEQPTKQEGEAATSKHPQQLPTGADQAGANTLSRQFNQEVAAAGDESTLQATQELPAPAPTSSSPSTHQQQQQQQQQHRPQHRVMSSVARSEGVQHPQSCETYRLNASSSFRADPTALERGKTTAGTWPSFRPGAPPCGPLHRPRSMHRQQLKRAFPKEQSETTWQQTQSPASLAPQSPTSVLEWGSFGTGLSSGFGSDNCPARQQHRVINSVIQSEGVGTPLSHTALRSHGFSTARSTCADPTALDSGRTCEGSRPAYAPGAPLRSPLHRPTQGSGGGRGMTRQHFTQAPSQQQSTTSRQQPRPYGPVMLPPPSLTSRLTWGSFGSSLSTGLGSDYGTECCPTMGPPYMGQVMNSPFKPDLGPPHSALNLPCVPSFCQGRH